MGLVVFWLLVLSDVWYKPFLLTWPWSQGRGIGSDRSAGMEKAEIVKCWLQVFWYDEPHRSQHFSFPWVHSALSLVTHKA